MDPLVPEEKIVYSFFLFLCFFTIYRHGNHKSWSFGVDTANILSLPRSMEVPHRNGFHGEKKMLKMMFYS